MKLEYLLLVVFFGLGSIHLQAQGCVAVRPMSCSSGMSSSSGGILMKGQWELNSNYQYFKSFRHFRGDEEEHERIENNTQVENISHALIINVGKALTDRLGVTASVPFLYYDRSSLYEHYGNSPSRNPDQKRFNTNAYGLGDIRLTMNYWLLDPMADNFKGNFALGAGLKLPTGNSNVMGTFHKLDKTGQDSLTTRPVDQSIQLGDGGWGFIVEGQGFWNVFEKGWMYFNGFYMFSPQTQNNTIRRGTLEGVDPLVAYHSIPDQFSARAGLNYSILPESGIAVSLGGRVEGVPSHDLIGKSEGYRRPGYVVSVEPGISYINGSFSVNLTVPFALYRNRTKSVYDLSDPNGERHGDAAFADYLINLSVGYRFGGKAHQHMDMDME